MQPVPVGMVVAGGGIETVAVVDTEAPGGGFAGVRQAHAEGGGVVGRAGVEGVRGDEGGPAEAAVDEVGAGAGAGEFGVGEQGAGAQRPAVEGGLGPPLEEADALVRLGVAGGEEVAGDAFGGASAADPEHACVGGPGGGFVGGGQQGDAVQGGILVAFTGEGGGGVHGGFDAEVDDGVVLGEDRGQQQG